MLQHQPSPKVPVLRTAVSSDSGRGRADPRRPLQLHGTKHISSSQGLVCLPSRGTPRRCSALALSSSCNPPTACQKRQIMIGLSGLVGLSVFCSVAGFTPGPAFTRLRPGASCGGRACSARQPSSKQENAPAPATCAGWRSVDRHTLRPTRMTTDGDGEPEATAAAPRLKRVRRRRKDAGSIATAEEEEADEVVAASSPIEQEPVMPAVAFESPAAAAVTVEEEEVSPPVVAPAAVQVPVSGGGTKGRKVRVSNADDELAESLASAASVASGVAGEAASVVGDAAKSAMGAAMSAIGQGGGSSVDEFDFDNVPRAGTGKRKKTTPGKSASDLADLGADIERYRKQENRQPEGVGESLVSGAKGVISSIIALDFFVVIAFMLWFIAGVVSSYGFSNTFLLDQFNEKWTSVVQPALGVLMGGTIAGGVVSKLGESGDENEGTR